MSQYTISPVGARIIEARANGLSIPELAASITDPPTPLDTLKHYAKLLYRDLGIATRNKYDRSFQTMGRAVGMCLVANLLRSRDLQRPGDPLKFTMTPDPDCLIQYDNSYTGFRPRRGRKPVSLAVAEPATPLIVPHGQPSRDRTSIVLSASIRSYLVDVLRGEASTTVMTRDDLHDITKSRVQNQQRRAGLGSFLQLAAHCAVAGVVDVPEEILIPGEEVLPIRYYKEATLELPLGAVAGEPA